MFIKTLLSTRKFNDYKVYIILFKSMILSLNSITKMEPNEFKVYENKQFIESQDLNRYWMIDLAKS